MANIRFMVEIQDVGNDDLDSVEDTVRDFLKEELADEGWTVLSVTETGRDPDDE